VQKPAHGQSGKGSRQGAARPQSGQKEELGEGEAAGSSQQPQQL